MGGERIGAALANMAAYQGYAAVAYPQGSLLSWTTVEKGGIIVGDDARRFGDESLGYSGYAREVLARGGRAYTVFDQKIFDVAAAEEEFMELWNYGGLKRGDTAEEIARPFGLDPQVLAGRSRNATQRRPGPCPTRTDGGISASGPWRHPTISAASCPGCFHTQGGLRVDADARVLRQDGAPVPNLFAGGGAAAGISGRAGALGYASGNGLCRRSRLDASRRSPPPANSGARRDARPRPRPASGRSPATACRRRWRPPRASTSSTRSGSVSPPRARRPVRLTGATPRGSGRGAPA